MNFNLTDEQAMLRDMIREFSDKEIAPAARDLEDKHEFPSRLLSRLAELGILGMSVPQEYGGTGMDTLSQMLAVEEISRAMPSLGVIVSVHCSLFCYAVKKYGTEEQKKRYLPGAASGKILGAFSLTEPEAGSDAMAIKASAVRRGDSFVLDGTKAWVTAGGEAGALIIFAKSEIKEAGRKMSAFIVDREAPGFRVSKIEEKMSLNASRTAEIVLEGCLVPAANLLGEEGRGAAIAFHCLDGSRIGIAAQSVGLAQRALEEALKYAKQREAFGRPIAELQAVQFMLADISTQLEASRMLTYRAAVLKDRGKPFTREASEAKLFASEAANEIVYKALQVHGGYGYSKEFIIEQLYRDARVLPIYEGTSEIQRLVIARELLR